MSLSDIIKAAKEYIAAGMHVLPLHRVRDGRCSCKDPHCKSPGKHPATINGVDGATNDPAKAEALFSGDVNLGVACWPWQVYDIDPRNGGDETWQKWTEGKEIPDTAQALTGGGGWHYLFSVPEGYRLKRPPGKGVDIKMAGGYIVAWPSIHVSGQQYQWEGSSNPLEGHPIAPAPDWMIEPFNIQSEIVAPHVGRQWLSNAQLAEIRDALTMLDPNPYDGYLTEDGREQPGWFAVLAALHSTGCPIARGLAEEWSMGSSKYSPTDFSKQWARLRASAPSKYRLESVFWWARANGWTDLQPEPPVGLIETVEPQNKPQVKLCEYAPPGVLKVLAEDIIRSSMRPQPRFAIQAALSLVATLFAQRVCTSTGLRSNLYLVSLGPTGCGKELGRQYIKRMMQYWGKTGQLAGETLASGQALMVRAALNPNALFQIDEIGYFLHEITKGGHKAEVLTNFTKLYSSAGTIISGSEYADPSKNPRQDIEYPCINLHATGTTSQFYEALKGRNVLDGAVNRMIIVESETVPEFVDGRLPDAPPREVSEWLEAVEQWMGRQFGNMQGVLPASPVMIGETPEAQELLRAYRDRIDKRMEAHRNAGDGLDCIWARAYENALKVALVCAMAHPAPVINEICAGWAIEYVEGWTEHLAVVAATKINDSEFGRLMGVIMEEMKKIGKGGASRGVLFNRKRLREVPVNQREQLMAALIENGEIILHNRLTIAGKSVIRYVLPGDSPKLSSS